MNTVISVIDIYLLLTVFSLFSSKPNKFSQIFLFSGHVLQLSNHVGGPALNSLQFIDISLVQRDQNWTNYTGCKIGSGKESKHNPQLVGYPLANTAQGVWLVFIVTRM